MISEDDITWVSGNDFVARQTIQLEKTFHSSRPKPRNRVMGFKDERVAVAERVLYGDGWKFNAAENPG